MLVAAHAGLGKRVFPISDNRFTPSGLSLSTMNNSFTLCEEQLSHGKDSLCRSRLGG